MLPKLEASLYVSEAQVMFQEVLGGLWGSSFCVAALWEAEEQVRGRSTHKTSFLIDKYILT